jgi:hypothetical protein
MGWNPSFSPASFDGRPLGLRGLGTQCASAAGPSGRPQKHSGCGPTGRHTGQPPRHTPETPGPLPRPPSHPPPPEADEGDSLGFWRLGVCYGRRRWQVSNQSLLGSRTAHVTIALRKCSDSTGRDSNPLSPRLASRARRPALARPSAAQVAPDITHVAAAYGVMIFVCAVVGLRCGSRKPPPPSSPHTATSTREGSGPGVHLTGLEG